MEYIKLSLFFLILKPISLMALDHGGQNSLWTCPTFSLPSTFSLHSPSTTQWAIWNLLFSIPQNFRRSLFWAAIVPFHYIPLFLLKWLRCFLLDYSYHPPQLLFTVIMNHTALKYLNRMCRYIVQELSTFLHIADLGLIFALKNDPLSTAKSAPWTQIHE